MLNKNLFNDPKDHTIAQLRMAIKNFKKYDAGRRQYYSDMLKEHAWMKERLDHAILLDLDEDPNDMERALLNLQQKLKDSKAKHKEQTKQINDLTTALTHYRIFSELTPDELREWKSNLELAKHEQKLLKAQADNERLLKANSELAAQLEQLRRTSVIA